MSSGNKEEEEELVTNLRAIIISSKGGLHLNDIRGDYRETFGTEIPLKVLGYSSLEQFFKTKSNEFRLFGNQVEAIAKSSSAHISSLVSKQQDAKKKSRSRASVKKRRRPIHSGHHSVYKPAVAHVPLKKHSFEIAPRFSKQVNENQILSIGNEKNQSFEKRSKTEKDEPATKTLKQDGAENGILSNRAENKIKNQYLSRTLQNFGVVVTKDSRVVKKKPEPKDVFDVASAKDAIPFDEFENYYVPPEPTKKRSSSSSSRSRDSSQDSLKIQSSKGNAQSRFEALKLSSAQQRLNRAKAEPVDDERLKIKREDDHEARLKELCLSKRLPSPVYLVTVADSGSTGTKRYAGTVKIGDAFHFVTDPPHAGTHDDARQSVSKKAIKELEDHPPAAFPYSGNSIREDWIAELENLCASKNLPKPAFQVFTTERDSSLYLSKVVIGKDHTFSSFPVEHPDENSARQVAAKKAYHFLSSELKFSIEKVSERERILTKRLLEIIGESYGMWGHVLPGLYKDRFGESLDRNWFTIIQKFPEFEINNGMNEENCIISRKQEESSIESESSDSIKFLAVPPSLKLPASVHWEVYVVNVHDSSQISCRLIGDEYSEAYDMMMTKLELNPPSQKVSVPVPNGYYAICVDQVWNRIKFLEESKEPGKGSVFFIDNGEEEDVCISELYDLDRSFLSLPPQAFYLSLHELDCFADDAGIKEMLLDKLLGNIFIAEIVTLSDLGKSVASVVLWDTSTDEDVNVSKQLLDSIVADILPPSLHKTNQLREVFVSEITDKGELFVVTKKEWVERIDRIIFKQTATGSDKNSLCTYDTINFTDLYLIRNEKTKKFGRSRVLRKGVAGHVEVLFVDSGFSQKAAIEDVYSLSKMSSSLASIPPQAMPVRLINLNDSDSKTVAKLRQHLQPGELVLAKVVGFEGDVPLVEIFKRSSPDNALTSINNLVLKESSLAKKEDKSRRKSVVVGLENVLCQKLTAPFVPSVGRYFDVFVTLAASPDLFTIQPLRSQKDLSDFMEKLQEYCENRVGSPPLRAEYCIVGDLYAAKHEDGNWYRGCLHLDLGSSTYSVYLCDFGDFVLVPLERLMPLPEEFSTFPYQAIRAKLAGITPVNKDWSATDSIYFQSLVVDKELVSVVVDINRDPSNPNNIMLGLLLVDTSGNEDVYIHQLLIDRKCAIDTTKVKKS